MELLYCYIKEFNSLKDAEFNFGWKYRFHYNTTTTTLTANSDEDYIVDFFSSNISNVSAIVGQNGTGKSTLIEFLIQYIPSGNNNADPEAIIIHYDEVKQELVVYLGATFYSTLNIQFGELTYTKVENLRNDYTYPEIIYFSNSLYDRIYDQNIQGLSNISLKNLLFNYDSKSFFIKDINVNPSQIYFNFRFKDYWRILRFLQTGLNTGIDFQLPKYLLLFINNNKEEYVFDKISTDYSFAVKTISNYYERLVKNYKDPKDQYIVTLEKAILFDFLAHYIEAKVVENLNFAELESPLRKRVLLKLIMGTYASNYQKIEMFLDSTEELLASAQNISVPIAWLDISKIKESQFKEYIDRLKTIFNWDSDYISIGFGFRSDSIDEFSSGQMAFLSLLGRFYSLTHEEQRFANQNVKDSALILIDEGELYLHPSWQKKMINLLVNTLPKIFSNLKIQIILTSHSPFVLSDLPKSKVIFLSQVATSNSEILEHKQTFAANVHTLLADTFFLSDGFIGDFAKQKIDHIIKDLNSVRQIEKTRKDEIRKIILGIGEPIIKRKLLEMYENKFNFDLDERVSNIETKLGL